MYFGLSSLEIMIGKDHKTIQLWLDFFIYNDTWLVHSKSENNARASPILYRFSQPVRIFA